MAAHLKACGQLDRSIRQESQTRTIFDPEVRRLRGALRAECEAALLADYRLSLKYDVEQLMWRAVFYRPIEEFRRRIKQAEGEMKAKIELAFQAYLHDAQAFYLQLAAKLQQRYGDASFPTALAVQHLQALGQEVVGVEAAAQPQDCRASVYRCLICLGDLARYGTSALPASERDWTACRHFYAQSARIYPEGGNSYNQLAVLSSYEGDDLAAAFHYCRALAAACPFPVARENLVTHFEQNRLACQKLAAGAGGGGSSDGGQARGMQPASQALKELRIRFTRLLGMLLSRSELDAFPQQLAATMADLDDHLQWLRQLSRNAAAAATVGEQPPLLLQLAATAIYAVHAMSADVAGQQQQRLRLQQGTEGPAAAASFSAAVQQQRVRGLALLLLFSLTARLASAAAAALRVVAAKPQQSVLGTAAGLLLLPPLRLMLQWLAAAGSDVLLLPAISKGTCPQQQQQLQEPAGLKFSRQELWQAAAELVAVLQQVQVAAAADEAAVPPPGMVVLPEDAQLAGFRHVSPALPSGAGAAAAEPYPVDLPVVGAVRVQRMLVDAAAIACVLAADVAQQVPLGLAAAQAAFVQAAGLPLDKAGGEGGNIQQQQQQQQEVKLLMRQPPQQQQHAVVPAAAARPLAAAAPVAMAPPAVAVVASAAAAAPAATGEEEPEEVILYAPPSHLLSKASSPSPHPVPVPLQIPLPKQQAAMRGAAEAVVPPPPPAEAPSQMQVPMPMPLSAPQPWHPHPHPQQHGADGGAPAVTSLAVPAVPTAVLAAPGQDTQMEDAELMEQTAQAVAGSVLPEGDRRPSPPLPPASHAAAAEQPHHPVVQAMEGFKLPAEFFSLFGQPQPAAHHLQEQVQQLRAPSLPPVSSSAGAAGRQALLFGDRVASGSDNVQQLQAHLAGPLLSPQQAPQPTLPAPTAGAGSGPGGTAVGAGNALLSSATAADRWAWMGAFGGGGTAGTGSEAGRVGTAGHPLGQQLQLGLRIDNPFVP